MLLAFAAVACLLAFVPCALFAQNLREYRPLSRGGDVTTKISVLIPARDEEANIAEALESVLRLCATEFEVLVLDDQSSDRTREIVEEISRRDVRVRLLLGKTPPASWCGKNFACQQLAEAARYPLLVFMDADVRVAHADSLARLATFMRESFAALASGLPREVTHTWLEKLIVPLIHFVLLGFLPLRRMRAGTDPRFAAACGQVIAARRDDYLRIGGHGAIAGRVHDAIALCRHFRAEGLRTDLFDATDTFDCRMYRNARGVWHGFAKNAREGLGANRVIVPVTFVLAVGQIAPFALLPWARGLTSYLLFLASVFALLPRFIAAIRFRQSILGAILHPLGIFLLLVNQWWARRATIQWKGRIAQTPRQSSSTFAT